MQRLHTKRELTQKCREVFDRAGLSKMDVSRVMNVSDPAVHYMINDPERGMADLRQRFLETFANLNVEGPGFLVEGTGTIPPQQATDLFPVSDVVLEALVEDGKVEATEEGRVIYASLYAHIQSLKSEAEKEAE